MRHNLLCGLFFLLLTQSSVLAQQGARLVPITTNSQNLSIFFDTKYLVRAGDLTVVQTYQRMNPPDEYGASQKITAYRFNCAKKLWTVASVTRLDSENIITDVAENEHVDQLLPLKEGSVGSVVYRYACPKGR